MTRRDVVANDWDRQGSNVRIPLHGEEERRLRSAARLAKVAREYARSLVQVGDFAHLPRAYANISCGRP